MVLSDTALRSLIPSYLPDGVHVGPCSVDLRLSNEFAIPDEDGLHYLDQPTIYKTIHASRYLLHPGEFVLASTMEEIRIPNWAAGHVHGRSSIGRLGLQVQNAGFIDAGFHGQITLELCNQSRNPIMLEAGWRICQLSLHRISGEVEKPYAGKYQHQKGATGSKIHEERKKGKAHEAVAL